jgi:predicted permease
VPGILALVAGLVARMQSLSDGLRRRDDIESKMRDEFRHHIEMRSADLVRQGVEPGEAARRAHVEFGHIDSHREHARAARGLQLFDQARFSWIDVKLALRMLVKHPLLTVAAVLALAVGIPVGLAPAHLAQAIEAPLPGDHDDRVRAIRYWNPLTMGLSSTGYEEFRFWSEQLESFSALAAFRTAPYNVALASGRAAPAPGALVTTSIFDILRVQPAMGRTLVAADGEPGAPAVVVIGNDLWKSRFGSDPDIVGRDIRIGPVLHTVVGVMPEGFRFPANEQLWLPLPQEPVAAVGGSSSVRILGRLADGVSAEQAQAELSAAGGPPILDLLAARLRLQAEVVPFGFLYMGLPRSGLASEPGYYFIQLLALSLLLVACGNVAMLLFARTATRFRELAVRTALGASRTRIVSQIFVEALVLSILAAGVGVFSIDWLLGHANLAAIAGESDLPYWLSLGVTGETLVRALVLAALSATVAGVLPAQRIIGRAVYPSIRSAEARRSGVRFGGFTGALIVADIAVSVAAVGFALAIAQQTTNMRQADELAGIPAEQYLAVEFTMPFSGSPNDAERRRFADRLATAQRKLVAQLQSEPGVNGVAVSDVLPRMEHRSQPIEVEGFERGPDDPPQWMRYARVDVDFFRALGQEAIAGRVFDNVDVEGGPAPVVVNAPFVDRMLAGQDPIGRRVRVQGDTAWHEIIGVVAHLGVNMVNSESGGAIYLPAAPGQINPFQVGIHVGSSPTGMVSRVRDIATRADPDLVMGTPVVLSDVIQGDLYLTIAMAAGLVLLVGVLIVLAVSGIYAMLSLSVSERTREIGILTALGAQRSTLVWVILRRSLLQIGGGAVIGVPVAAWLLYQLAVSSSRTSPLDAIVVAVGLAAGIVVIVGLFACLAPTRRVMAIDANEALKADG